MPTFSYKALQVRRQNCRGRAGRRQPAGRAAADGDARPAPGEPGGKNRRKAAKNGSACAVGRLAGDISFKFGGEKSFGEGTGKFHAAAVQPARGGRAVEPRAGDFAARKPRRRRRRPSGRKSTTWSWTACRWRTRWRNRRKRFRASMSRWSRRARPAAFSTWCWRRSRNFRRAKRS